ncbi:MAG: hypothetical protein NTV49_00710 [Kiritimatiellaeota bacterium]|nr:hypothetical protein [Kiritimatiellota bacterium]
MSHKKKSPGRPPKFNEARHPITVTLPERTLQQLAAIHDDRARAIVKATETTTRVRSGKAPPVEVVEVAPGQAVIVVGPSRSLRQINWLGLVEISPSRFLLTIPTGTAMETLEVAVGDLRENLPPSETYERDLLAALHHLLSLRRRQKAVSKVEILLVRPEGVLPAKATA